ncbi:hypothetical protein EVAR_56838_1 [Eumeta japonica]|uniref:Uncharacterized protein n=1 Tax=Eumeta variegata TaxID=151549 RepID=A0A4C1ZEA6_EUMVA|nr:hypothetical protein EVAR_56838_1 [Eumeta japonica]
MSKVIGRSDGRHLTTLNRRHVTSPSGGADALRNVRRGVDCGPRTVSGPLRYIVRGGRLNIARGVRK